MAQKFYIVQAGFLPVGASDVTGWRSHSFYSGRRAYDDAMAEYEKEVRKNLHPRRMFRVVCTEHCSRKDGLIFVSPRMIPICFSGEMSECQRPLRAQTAQGERVSLANSEQIPAGSTCEFEVLCMDDSHEKAVLEWLNYGAMRGIGQWRNSGKGRFTYEILD